MAIKTKVKFVEDIIRDNPDATRTGIINKIGRAHV